jgi:hypothetical protein
MIANNSKKHCATLVATFDKDANHVLITHKRKHSAASTYECAMATGELDASIGAEFHVLTPEEINWLTSINDWIEECYESV